MEALGAAAGEMEVDFINTLAPVAPEVQIIQVDEEVD